jgi:hypothetical protein
MIRNLIFATKFLLFKKVTKYKKMKSVGIITIQKSNFGGCLQSYALWTYIESIGYNCEIIDLYRPVMKGYKNETNLLSFTTTRKNVQSKSIKPFIIRIYSLLQNYIRQRNYKYNFINNKNFELFNSLIKYSQPYKSIDSLYKNPPEYDIYITGSDQVWNPDMPFENEPYLLTFAPIGKKLIAYASSFGRVNLPDEFKINYKKCLEKYDLISVREETGQKIIGEIAGMKSNLVIDPTMLLDVNYWQIISTQPDIMQKYLFCFSLNSNSELIKYASKICKNNKLVLVIISNNMFDYEGVKTINKNDSGPKEWLGLIENAEIVITDSFHGTVFSILFNRQFQSFIDKSKNKVHLGTRIENILNKLSLESQLINNLSIEKEISKIEYSKVNAKLEQLRMESKNFIDNALEM